MYQYIRRDERRVIKILPLDYQDLITNNIPFWQAEIFPEFGTIFYRFNVSCNCDSRLYDSLVDAVREATGVNHGSSWFDFSTNNFASRGPTLNAAKLFQHFRGINSNLENLKTSLVATDNYFNNFRAVLGGDNATMNIDIKSETATHYSARDKQKFLITYRLDIHLKRNQNDNPCRSFGDIMNVVISSIDQMKSVDQKIALVALKQYIYQDNNLRRVLDPFVQGRLSDALKKIALNVLVGLKNKIRSTVDNFLLCNRKMSMNDYVEEYMNGYVEELVIGKANKLLDSIKRLGDGIHEGRQVVDAQILQQLWGEQEKLTQELGAQIQVPQVNSIYRYTP